MTNNLTRGVDVGKGICSVDGCETGVLAKGFCSIHYARNRKHGDPLYVIAYDKDKPCKAPKCSRLRRKHGYCGMHAQRYAKYGTWELPERDRPLCAGPECKTTLDPLQHSSGLCNSHYKQQHLGKPLTPLLVATKDLGRPEVCVVDGCTRPHKARGFCKTHSQWTQAGKDLTGDVQLRLPPGPCALEECDQPRLANTYCARHNYSFVHRWSLYGLTAELGQQIYEAQGECCAICKAPAPIHQLSIDHDHACCKRKSCGTCVRGLLCTRCNLGIGSLGDDPERLIAAARYLLAQETPGEQA